ncbi:hypothetical protein NEHOM01_1041 [Nematocida homosporus]|uniref:uncharacterized protein n=1 Tax=Nematocida homosporus TaxID=1912981 RepID=UPI00221F8C96|nr:uncharacterized protein NEHOM01_1041 [Nematocida homosporus]KAI5185764.1 hypothetical protein NEHOM01_1041 [Nematocida homosporus]
MQPDQKEDAYTVQLENRLARLSGLMGVFRERVDSLEKTVKSLEDKVSTYALELSKAYKETNQQ